MLVPLAVLLCTLVRVPSLMVRLRSRNAAAPKRDPALVRCTGVAISFPDRGQLQLMWENAEGQAQPDAEICKLWCHLIGDDAWEDAGKVFGGMLVATAKGMLPFSLSETMNVDLCDLNQQLEQDANGSLNISMGDHALQDEDANPLVHRGVASAMLLHMQNTAWLQVEYEAQDQTSGVLLRAPVQLQTGWDAWSAKDTSFVAAVPAEVLCLEPPWDEFPSGGEVRRTLWFEIGAEFVQLALDFIHLLLCAIVLVTAPWRLIKAIRRMREHPHQRLRRLCNTTWQDLLLFSEASLWYRGQVAAALTTMVKQEARACGKRVHPSSFQPLTELRTEVTRSRQRLVMMLKRCRASAESMPTTQREHVEHFLKTLSEAASFEDGASDSLLVQLATAQMYTIQTRITEETLAVLTEVLVDADAQAQAYLEQEHARLQEELAEISASIDLDPAVNQGFFVNDLQSNRKCIKDAVLGCVKDYGTLILVMGLVTTVYRLPVFVSELYSRVTSGRQDRPITKVWLFFLLIRHLTIVGHDLVLTAKTLFFSVLVLLTLVRAPDLLSGLAQNVTSLQAMHDVARKNLNAVCRNLWELCALVTVWKTYRIGLKAMFFLFMLPAASLHHVLATVSAWRPNNGARESNADLEGQSTNAAPDNAGHGCAVAASISLWMFVVAACLMPLYASEVVSEPTWLVFMAIISGCIWILGLVCRLIDIELHEDQTRQPFVRITGANMLLLTTIFSDNIIMLLLFYPLREAVSGFIETLQQPVSVWCFGVGVVGAYLLLVSVPWVSGSDQENVRTSAPYICLELLFQSIFLLTAATLLVQLLLAVVYQDDTELPAAVSSTLLLFLLTTFQLGFTSKPSVLADSQLDVRYSMSFMCAVRLLQVSTLAVQLLPSSFICQLLLLAFVWLLVAVEVITPSITTVCQTDSIPPLRMGSVAMYAATVTICTFTHQSGSDLVRVVVGSGVFVLVGILTSVARGYSLYRQQQEQIANSKLPQALDALGCLRGRLVVTQIAERSGTFQPQTQIPDVSSISSPEQVASALKQFENSVCADRMSVAFLEARPGWLADLDAASERQSYDSLAELASSLHAEIRDPHTVAAVFAVLRAWDPVGEQDKIPHSICMMILNYIIADCELIEQLSRRLTVVPQRTRRPGAHRDPILGAFQICQLDRFRIVLSHTQNPNSGQPLERAPSADTGWLLWDLQGRPIGPIEHTPVVAAGMLEGGPAEQDHCQL